MEKKNEEKKKGNHLQDLLRPNSAYLNNKETFAPKLSADLINWEVVTHSGTEQS